MTHIHGDTPVGGPSAGHQPVAGHHTATRRRPTGGAWRSLSKLLSCRNLSKSPLCKALDSGKKLREFAICKRRDAAPQPSTRVVESRRHTQQPLTRLAAGVCAAVPQRHQPGGRGGSRCNRESIIVWLRRSAPSRCGASDFRARPYAVYMASPPFANWFGFGPPVSPRS